MMLKIDEMEQLWFFSYIGNGSINTTETTEHQI